MSLLAVIVWAFWFTRPSLSSAPLPQRSYLWQRTWTPAVLQAATEGNKRLHGIVILGAEIHCRGRKEKPEVIRPAIPWGRLKESSYAAAIRVAPYSGPFQDDGEPLDTIIKVTSELLEEAQKHGVILHELQCDFDAAQSKLAGYQIWLKRLRTAIHPMPLVVTTLPSWLYERSAFRALIGEVDGYVLQVHSVPLLTAGGRAELCDPMLARRWVNAAAQYGRPFSVALPTYRCLAGYAPDGKLLGVAMDSVQPAWPGDTRVLDFASDANALGDLVNEWQKAHPPEMKEIIWYRLPIASDQRNWRWPTLDAVMAGRRPKERLVIEAKGEALVDLEMVNEGEAECAPRKAIRVTAKGAALVASDALPGWSITEKGGTTIFSPAAGHHFPLRPGERRGIGWVRYDKPLSPQCEWITDTMAQTP